MSRLVRTNPRPSAQEARAQRRPRDDRGATSRSKSPRVTGSDTRCSTPRDAESPDEFVRTPDGSDSAADGNPSPDGVRRREPWFSGHQGGSIVEDNGGEGCSGRSGAEVGASGGLPGSALDSTGSGTCTSDGYVKVSVTPRRADLLGEGTPQPSGIGLQCSWGMHTAGQVPKCLMRPRYEVPLTCFRPEDGEDGREELGDWK